MGPFPVYPNVLARQRGEEQEIAGVDPVAGGASS